MSGIIHSYIWEIFYTFSTDENLICYYRLYSTPFPSFPTIVDMVRDSIKS